MTSERMVSENVHPGEELDDTRGEGVDFNLGKLFDKSEDSMKSANGICQIRVMERRITLGIRT
jgi:hypothetical protein